MSSFFEGTDFNDDISGWDTGSVTSMYRTRDLDWDVSSVRNMRLMFTDATSFDGDISGWIMNSVTNNVEYMFWNAASFNQDISGWDSSKFGGMDQMFDGATSFNQDLSGWDTSSGVGSLFFMFNGATVMTFDLCWVRDER